MPNVFVDTWRIGRQLRADFAGYPLTITIGAAVIDADLQEASDDEILVAGGKIEKGGQTILVALEDLPGGVIPIKHTEVVTSEGRTAKWLSSKQNVGIVTALIGEPLARDRKTGLMT